jgi:hypothetical protein
VQKRVARESVSLCAGRMMLLTGGEKICTNPSAMSYYYR